MMNVIINIDNNESSLDQLDIYCNSQKVLGVACCLLKVINKLS